MTLKIVCPTYFAVNINAALSNAVHLRKFTFKLQKG